MIVIKILGYMLYRNLQVGNNVIERLSKKQKGFVSSNFTVLWGEQNVLFPHCHSLGNSCEYSDIEEFNIHIYK